jgi:predicted O-methyltransferase YrrM
MAPGSADASKITHRREFGWRSRPVFAALGVRPVNSEHTPAEGVLLQKWARDKRLIVEIGVAEGGSAAEMRQVMHPDGELFLIDPYHLSRLPGPLRFARRAAHRIVGSVDRGRVMWIEDFSVPAVKQWKRKVDFLFIDGDHSVKGAKDDWDAWTPWVADGGHVVLHDSRTEAPWISDGDGPVELLRAIAEDPTWQIVDEADSMTVLRRA